MKRVVNDLRYDTEKAEKIGVWSNCYPCNDFHYCQEILYRTSSGRFFLHGEGGAMSKYSESCGQNSWCGSQAILPLTPDEAREWLADHDLVDELEEYFSDQFTDA